MQFPDFLEPYRSDGQKLLLQGAVKGVSFSGPTYQIEVRDPLFSDSLWVFLQLDDKYAIKDLFCSCEESTEKGACPHMAAACLYAFSKQNRPLGARFEESLWHRLFFDMLEKAKARKARVVQKESRLEVFADKELLFTAEGKAEEFQTLLALLSPKVEETEETSIKFSNLSEEEIEHWRKGRPSLRLRYELSPFADIAKWLFFLQERGASLKVTFDPVDRIPENLQIAVDKLILKMPCDMLSLVPTLNSVQANLQLLDERTYNVKSVEFDPKKRHFTLHFFPEARVTPKGGIPYGPWLFLPKLGFMSLVHRPKTLEVIKSAQEIQRLFDESLALLKEHLSIPIQEDRRALFYDIYFDETDKTPRLHIEAYLEKPGDLQEAAVWGEWVYYKGKFLKIENLKFETAHLVLDATQIPSFLLAHRAWLSQFLGFHVHVAKLEEQILYEVDEIGNLTFRSVLQKHSSKNVGIELGDWLYVKGDGFFVKNFTEDNPPLPLDKMIPKHLVADFIRHHIDLVEGISSFFMSECPIVGIGLSVRLKKRGLIEILPEYEWQDNRDRQMSFFYDEFVFVKDKGFYRLPPNFRPMHFIREISSLDPQAWNSFFQELLPKLKEEYQCRIDPRLEKAEKLALTVLPEERSNMALNNVRDWSLDIYWKSDSGTIPIQELVTAKMKQERFVPTDAGVIDLTDDRFHWLDTVKKGKKGPVTLAPTDFLRVTAYDTIHVETKGSESREVFKKILEKLLVQKPPTPHELSSLNCELRSYQELGVEWLWFLYQNGLSGLLCDDMGVGKTHQAMGVMDAVRTFNRKEKKKSLFLVVCPTSLVYHWQDKLERYLPDFKIKSYVGFSRELDDFPGDYDIMLTSYGIWRNESHRLKKYFFDVAFFDELQIAKNHVSQIHNALLQVQAAMKIGLTGTPIENQLRELKAVFDIILPGYMPNDSAFREFFMRPIERDDPKRKSLLSRFVRPFVLRRKKSDVLKDLPEKTEEIYIAELAPEQKSLYRQISSQQVLPLIQQLRDDSSPIPYMHIFAVLSALKQVCNHPAAYLKDVQNYERYESGKWEAFVELVEEAMESEQKVVVFSQFLAMLDIMESFLKKSGIGYAQIRGQTKNRGDEVGRFDKDPNCKVFLGSLQAAGLGIDLTAASVVIHYDRWWNAARENQATDRVHRIGQVRGVQVFKLLTKATIEEKIDLMISRKASLLEDVVSFDDHQIVKRLSRHEIISLLEGLPED